MERMLKLIGIIALVMLGVWLLGGLVAGVLGGLVGLVAGLLSFVFGIVGFVLKLVGGLVLLIVKAGLTLVLLGVALLAIGGLVLRALFRRGDCPRAAAAWRSHYGHSMRRRDDIHAAMDESLRRAEERMARLEGVLAERLRRRHFEPW